MSEQPDITIERQATFGTDGDLEVSTEAVATSLDDFGVELDYHDRPTRIAHPEASTFGIDDRPAVRTNSQREQAQLFADTDEDQRTLTGGPAAEQCLFDD